MLTIHSIIGDFRLRFKRVFDQTNFFHDGELACVIAHALGVSRPGSRRCCGQMKLKSIEQSSTCVEIWATCPLPYARRFYSAFSRKDNIEHKLGVQWL